MAAWIGSLPVLLLAFHLVSTISVIANITVFPLAAAMFGLAVLAVLGGAFWQTWAVWMNNANWLVAKLFLALLRFFDAIPGGSFHVAAPEFWRWPAPAAELTILDLGPGRAAGLHTDGLAWLADTGRPGDYARVVQPFLQARGVDRLDGLLLTEADAYHLSAAPLVMADLQPAHIFLSDLPGRSPSLREIRALLSGRHQTPRSPAAGVTIAPRPGCALHVLFPPAAPAGKTAAGRAVIFRLEAGGWRVLWLGDSDAETHRWLSTHYPPADLRSDVIILGHAPTKHDEVAHTADVESETEFQESIRPRLLIRQRGRAGEGYKAAAGGVPCPILSQESAGAVTLRLYPDRLEVNEFLSGKVTTLRPP